MAFTSTVTGSGVMGNRRFLQGTWNASGVHRGAITAGNYIFDANVSVDGGMGPQPRTKVNVDQANATSAGSLGFLAVPRDATGTFTIWFL